MYFIDFLNDLSDGERYVFEQFLEESIDKYKDKNSILEKYYWLLRYYKKKFDFQNNFLESIINGVLL